MRVTPLSSLPTLDLAHAEVAVDLSIYLVLVLEQST